MARNGVRRKPGRSLHRTSDRRADGEQAGFLRSRDGASPYRTHFLSVGAASGEARIVTSHTKPSGWVGRSIRRLEDPALVTGRGRFTGDLPAAKWVRFVRSPVAAGRITRILAPDGVMLITAAEV